MKWHKDDTDYLERLVLQGKLQTALRVVTRHPGLPADTAADLARCLQGWEPCDKKVSKLRSELLDKFKAISKSKIKQCSLLEPLLETV